MRENRKRKKREKKWKVERERDGRKERASLSESERKKRKGLKLFIRRRPTERKGRLFRRTIKKKRKGLFRRISPRNIVFYFLNLAEGRANSGGIMARKK